MFAIPQEIKIISVTKLNRFAKQVLESEIGQIWVSGEISNFVQAASGHWYFTLKDEKAQVRTAMFKGANRSVGFNPKHGDKVLVRANISLYEARGEYQLVALEMEPEGLGKLKQEFEALKKRLDEEGLFAHKHKKTLPEHIKKIGLITSATGAAVHDVLHVLKRRNPAIEVIIYPSMVQGEGAADTIGKQIVSANKQNIVDVLIVGRGGGSLEDLWAFNDEQLARTIYASDLPIVSAVGHEVDVSIADFVADIRAATPSAAAELLSKDKQSLVRELNQSKIALMRSLDNILHSKQKHLEHLVSRLDTQHPVKSLQQKAQSFDYLRARLEQQHINKQIAKNKEKLAYLQQRLEARHPSASVSEYKKRFKDLHDRMYQAMRLYLQNKQHKQDNYHKDITHLSPLPFVLSKQEDNLEKLKQLQLHIDKRLEQKANDLARVSAVLNTVSPLATLSRGYSITFREESLLRTSQKLKTGDKLTTKLVDGEISSTVTQVDYKPKSV